MSSQYLGRFSFLINFTLWPLTTNPIGYSALPRQATTVPIISTIQTSRPNTPQLIIGENTRSSEKQRAIAPLPEFTAVIEYAQSKNLAANSLPNIMQAIADYFLGTPYVANLLDGSSQEKLVINLKGFDCVLFVENVLAIARGIVSNDYSFDNFVQGIENLRYRDGRINGYCSRLHYFSDWIRDNEKRGMVVNITEKLGGIRLDKQRDFMTNHRNSYPQLADDLNYQCLVNVEDQLSQTAFSYIPTAEISNIYDQLQPGDIIGVATAIRGLDFTHTGLVYQLSSGNMGLIHASPAGEVVIARDLQTYISRVESAIGIVVARPVDPRSLPVANPVEQMLP
jgi:hypothetical protein